MGNDTLKQKEPPLLSIGILFKNEIRCIRRCLESLRPLREAAPCELIMADTGSTDGSRAVAEQFADLLVDFPWVDDFSAARNAVLSRASGRWFLTIDCDEWLDRDISLLLSKIREPSGVCVCLVTQRNYRTPECGDAYSDVLAGRLFTRTPESRYEGTVHEQYHTYSPLQKTLCLPGIILHHDGYVNSRRFSFSDNRSAAKSRCYRQLLKNELEKDPDNLFRMYELLDCTGNKDAEYPAVLCRAVEKIKLLREQTASGAVHPAKNNWQRFGPPILCAAVEYAVNEKLPELSEWASLADDWFPQSLTIRMDMSALLAQHAFCIGNLLEAVRRGETYLRALEDFQNGSGKLEQADGGCQCASPSHARLMKLILAASCAGMGRTDRALELLHEVPAAQMDPVMTAYALEAAANLYGHRTAEGGTLAAALWDSLPASEDSPEGRDAARREAFLQKGLELFDRRGLVPLWPVFLPLAGRCPLGDAAAMMKTEDSARLSKLLSEQEDWKLLPARAFAHAMEHGAAFPVPGRETTAEDLEDLAGKLAALPASHALLRRLALHADTDRSVQAGTDRSAGLFWAAALTREAVRVCLWDAPEDMELARAYVRAARSVLPLRCSAECLTEAGVFLLPPEDRFAWYCVQSLDAMDGGDYSASVRFLRSALKYKKDRLDMVRFLMDVSVRKEKEAARASAPPELLRLAEQVRAILSAYPSDDPAVLALKNSPAYQRVAYLVEA